MVETEFLKAMPVITQSVLILGKDGVVVGPGGGKEELLPTIGDEFWGVG